MVNEATHSQLAIHHSLFIIRILPSSQNPSGQPFAIITSVEQVADVLYLGSLTEPALARISAPE